MEKKSRVCAQSLIDSEIESFIVSSDIRVNFKFIAVISPYLSSKWTEDIGKYLGGITSVDGMLYNSPFGEVTVYVSNSLEGGNVEVASR